jgi:hypothetical protein
VIRIEDLDKEWKALQPGELFFNSKLLDKMFLCLTVLYVPPIFVVPVALTYYKYELGISMRAVRLLAVAVPIALFPVLLLAGFGVVLLWSLVRRRRLNHLRVACKLAGGTLP